MIDECPWHLAFWARIKKRLLPFLDLTTWILLLIAIVPLAIVNPPMLMTLLQWTAFAVALAGVAVLLCRVMLPMVDLGALYDAACDGTLTMQQAVIFAATVMLLALLFLGLILWGKA